MSGIEIKGPEAMSPEEFWKKALGRQQIELEIRWHNEAKWTREKASIIHIGFPISAKKGLVYLTASIEGRNNAFKGTYDLDSNQGNLYPLGEQSSN